MINFQVIPIMIIIEMMGYKNKNLSDYLMLLAVQRHQAYWLFKFIFTQVTIYVNLFFTTLVLCGMLINEQIPKKLVNEQTFFLISKKLYNVL